jgi:hypothetical protein
MNKFAEHFLIDKKMKFDNETTYKFMIKHAHGDYNNLTKILNDLYENYDRNCIITSNVIDILKKYNLPYIIGCDPSNDYKLSDDNDNDNYDCLLCGENISSKIFHNCYNDDNDDDDDNNDDDDNVINFLINEIKELKSENKELRNEIKQSNCTKCSGCFGLQALNNKLQCDITNYAIKYNTLETYNNTSIISYNRLVGDNKLLRESIVKYGTALDSIFNIANESYKKNL